MISATARADWTATPGTWAAVAGEYRSPHNKNIGVSSVGEASWSNYAGQAKLKFGDAWKSAGLIAYGDDEGAAGYYLRVSVDGALASHNLQLLNGKTVLASVNLAGAYDFKQFHEVKISVANQTNGVHITGLIDGNPHLDTLDTTSAFTAGKFALRAEPWTGVIVADDVIVKPN